MSSLKKKNIRIAVSGSAGNPPTLAHRAFAETLTNSGLFDVVLWVLSGKRDDKPNLIDAKHRVHMTELTFSDAWIKKQPSEFRLDFRDAFRENTPTIHLLEELQKEYRNSQIFFATGADVLVPQERLGGKCEVEFWHDGSDLLHNWLFVVSPRSGYLDPQVLQAEGKISSNYLLLGPVEGVTSSISSTMVRNTLATGGSIEGLVAPLVDAYIRTNGLYI